MESNPYASPAAPPAYLGRAPSAAPLAFLASLVTYLAMLPYIYDTVATDRPWERPVFPKVLVSVSSIVAVLGIATFTMLAHASGKPIGLGRGVCVAHLIVTAGEALSLTIPVPRFLWLTGLRPLHWYDWCNGLPDTMLLFAFVEIILLHRALKRLEKPSPLANWTLFALLTIDPAVLLFLDGLVYTQHYRLGSFYNPLRAIILATSQGIICLLLAWRVQRMRRNWRSEAQPQGRDDHEDALGRPAWREPPQSPKRQPRRLAPTVRRVFLFGPNRKPADPRASRLPSDNL